MPCLNFSIQSDSEFELFVSSKAQPAVVLDEGGGVTSKATELADTKTRRKKEPQKAKPGKSRPEAKTGSKREKWNLNDANADLIESVCAYFGPVTSLAVVERQPFESWKEVELVPGVGEYKLEELQRKFVLRPPSKDDCGTSRPVSPEPSEV